MESTRMNDFLIMILVLGILSHYVSLRQDLNNIDARITRLEILLKDKSA